MRTLERSIALAVAAHLGQADRMGQPYILHPLRVMFRMSSENDMMAAVLHDVVEHVPGWTFDRLAKEGVPPVVVEAVRHLTKRAEEEDDHLAFTRRAAQNAIARRVRAADLEDNMDIRRIAAPTSRDLERIAEYRRSWEYLRSLE